MSLIINQPPIDWEKAQKADKLFGENLLDHEEFKPLVEMALSGYLSSLKSYCEQLEKNYEDKLRKLCEIWKYEFGYYEIILPRFMTTIDVQENNDYYKLWNKLVMEWTDKN